MHRCAHYTLPIHPPYLPRYILPLCPFLRNCNQLPTGTYTLFDPALARGRAWVRQSSCRIAAPLSCRFQSFALAPRLLPHHTSPHPSALLHKHIPTIKGEATTLDATPPQRAPLPFFVTIQSTRFARPFPFATQPHDCDFGPRAPGYVTRHNSLPLGRSINGPIPSEA